MGQIVLSLALRERVRLFASQARSKADQNLPVVALAIRSREHRGRIADDVLDHPIAEDHREFAVLQRVHRWQDQIGVTGGLVAVDVDRDQELEAL